MHHAGTTQALKKHCANATWVVHCIAGHVPCGMRVKLTLRWGSPILPSPFKINPKSPKSYRKNPETLGNQYLSKFIFFSIKISSLEYTNQILGMRIEREMYASAQSLSQEKYIEREL